MGCWLVVENYDGANKDQRKRGGYMFAERGCSSVLTEGKWRGGGGLKGEERGTV